MLRALFTMSAHLNDITDWEERAQTANYCVKTLAAMCKISTRQLQRFIRKNWGVAPRVWMNELRQRRALSLLATAHTVREVASELGFSSPENFTRAFRNHYGLPPTHVRNSISI
jgi:AraC-like DNA-binding protein